jgi:peptide/nickel transport system ATP-binding protein
MTSLHDTAPSSEAFSSEALLEPLDTSAVRPARQAARLLRVSDLHVRFETRRGQVHALDGVSFEVRPGERVGLVGESGSGKSVVCLSIMGLLDRNAKVTQGNVTLGDQELLSPSTRSKTANQLSMIFQYPRTALNPIRRIGDQLIDVLQTMSRAPRAELKRNAAALLAEVHISRPEERLRAYPFELSGGQCQRVLIAMALARAPSILVADEPTTGLDVVTQKAIMALIDEARLAHGMSTILITHDLALAGEFCDRIVVMQRGKVIEMAETAALFRAPQHPYTRALLLATPAVTQDLSALRRAVEADARD